MQYAWQCSRRRQKASRLSIDIVDNHWSPCIKRTALVAVFIVHAAGLLALYFWSTDSGVAGTFFTTLTFSLDTQQQYDNAKMCGWGHKCYNPMLVLPQCCYLCWLLVLNNAPLVDNIGTKYFQEKMIYIYFLVLQIYPLGRTEPPGGPEVWHTWPMV